MAAPAKRGISPIVWILIGLAGIVVLGIVGMGITAMYFAKNPGLVMAKLITASNPNVEVLSTDMGSQTVRIRDKKTGEEVTLSFDDVKKGRLKFSARGDNGEVASVEIGGGDAKLPSWVPAYPGAKAQGNMTARGTSSDGSGEGGVVTFVTPDSPSKVTAYYEGKCKDLGADVKVTQSSDMGGMLVCADEAGERSLNVLVGGSSGDTTITLTYGRKK